MDDMDDMLKDFVVEAMDLAVNVEEHLLRLERDPDNRETLNAVFRSFHTIKGGAGFMNLPAMVAACHLTENLFDAFNRGNTSAARKTEGTGLGLHLSQKLAGRMGGHIGCHSARGHGSTFTLTIPGV